MSIRYRSKRIFFTGYVSFLFFINLIVSVTFIISVFIDSFNLLTFSAKYMHMQLHMHVHIDTSSIFTTLGTNVDVFGMVVLEEGPPGTISFKTPGAYTDAIVEL